jgi:hypothetical protein
VVIERTHAWGNQYGKLRWCTERRRVVVEFWLALAPPRSCVAGWSAARGPATAGTAGHGDGRDHLWRSPFARVSLDAGQSRQVSVAFPVSRLAVRVGDIDAAGRREVPPGAYQVQVEDLTADFTVSG